MPSLSPVNVEPRPRLLFVDNLRWTIILLVISMHAADTYSPLGSWYFTDRTPLTPATLLVFAAWQTYLQSFFMGLLFFIAGIFTPPSFRRKGPASFTRDRAFRLGLPVLFYMFILGPITEYFVAHSWTSTLPTSFANEWIKHIRNGQFLQENGPLWFCLALLIFSLIYAGVPQNGSAGAAAAPKNKTLILFALGMAACTFLVRLGLPSGASFLNMHLGDFPQYVLLFGAGILAERSDFLSKLSPRSGKAWLLAVLPAGFTAWLTLLITGGAIQGNTQAYSGGWHWQSAAIDLWESFTCVAIALGLLTFYREAFDSQGRIAKFMSDNAFAVYVFHPPIVILAAQMLHGFAWPPLMKFAMLTLIAATASFLLSAAVFRKIPLLRRIL